ncbi:MAG: hypothetical protein ACRELB_21490 [Polyangiaceae bacterium]
MPRHLAVTLAAVAVAVPATLVLGEAIAHADVSSWLAVGGGATTQMAQGAANRDYAGSFHWSFGVGSSPLAPFVVGVIYRGTTSTGFGTDLGAGVRLATGGFARGSWGAALDAGVAWRTWGSGSYGDSPLQGVLTLGGPWGLQLALGVQAWTLDNGVPAQGAFAALELDLLRLTVMRQGSSEKWWPNPAPAGGHEKAVSLLSF